MARQTRTAAPEPAEIYERTRTEGRRRLSRPLLELAATALVGGFDIAFGLGFVFVVVGRSELFTENFLVPIAGLDRRNRGSWAKLAELWAATLVLNVAGGVVLTIILTSNGVLRGGAGAALDRLADHVAGYDAGTAFLSAVAAGALMTLMTWFVEGAAESMGVRIVMAWLVGSLLVLGAFNHAVVSTVELVFGLRGAADVGYGTIFGNLGLAVGGNLVGGLVLVTFARTAQALGGGSDA